jgi:acyl-CoA thioesterase I
MKRFFERIQQKALDVSLAPVVIAALGDSVTQGVMEHKLLASDTVYHRLLQEELERFFPTTSFSTLNAGVSGGGAPHGLARLQRDVIRHQPDLVLIAFGLNDCLDGEPKLSEFTDALRGIITQVRAETEADILLVTPPFMATQASARIHPEHETVGSIIIDAQNNGSLNLYAQAIRDIAQSTKVPYADVHAEWTRLSQTGVDTNLWLINGLNHPDVRGHRLAATVIFHELLSLRISSTT